MREIAEISESPALKNTADVLGGVANVLSSTAQGAATGGWIGALVGGVTSIFSEVVDAIIQSEVAIEKNQQALREYNNAIELLALSIDSAKFDTIFGEDVWGRIEEISSSLSDATLAFNKFNEKAYLKITYSIEAVGAPIYNPNYDMTDPSQSIIHGVPASIANKLKFEYESLSNATIRKDEKDADTTTLGAMFPDLFDEKGNLRLDKIEEAKLALQSLESMALDDNTGVPLLKKAIERGEAVNKAMEEINKAASEYLDSIGPSLGDSIVNGILKGEDALKSFGNVAGSIIEQIAKDFASSWMIENYLKTFEESMQNAFISGDAKQVTDVVNQIVAGLPTVIETAEAATKEILDMTKGTDYDLYKKYEKESQQASSKGYGTLSEETGKELSGRALAQYESNLRIEASQRESTNTLLDMKGTMVDMVVAQQSTNFIAEDCRQLIAHSYIELQAIRENTDAMVNPIKNLSEKINKWDSKIMEL